MEAPNPPPALQELLTLALSPRGLGGGALSAGQQAGKAPSCLGFVVS